MPRAFRVRLERLREAHQPRRFARRVESRPARARRRRRRHELGVVRARPAVRRAQRPGVTVGIGGYVRHGALSFCPSFARCVLRRFFARARRRGSGAREESRRAVHLVRGNLARAHRRARRVRRVLLALQDRAHARARACVVDCRPREAFERALRDFVVPEPDEKHAPPALRSPSVGGVQHGVRHAVPARRQSLGDRAYGLSPAHGHQPVHVLQQERARAARAEHAADLQVQEPARVVESPPVAPSGEGLAREPARQHVVIRNHALAHVRDVPDHQRTSVSIRGRVFVTAVRHRVGRVVRENPTAAPVVDHVRRARVRAELGGEHGDAADVAQRVREPAHAGEELGEGERREGRDARTFYFCRGPVRRAHRAQRARARLGVAPRGVRLEARRDGHGGTERVRAFLFFGRL